jgi:hypothetical protein
MSGLFGGGNSGGGNQPTPVSSLFLQSSTRGNPIPIAYGKPRLSPNLIWYGDLIATAHEQQQQSGKGGSGAPSTITYTYTASLVFALCEGAVNGITRIWRDKELFSGVTVALATATVQNEYYRDYDASPIAVANQAAWVADLGVTCPSGEYDPYTLRPGIDYTVSNGVYTFSNFFSSAIYISYTYLVSGEYTLDACGQLGLTYVPGTYSQSAIGWLASTHPSQSLAYRGTALVAGSNYALLADAHLQNHSFEIDTQTGYGGSIRDANPKDVFLDLLTNPYYGCAFPADRLGNLSSFSNYCVANNIFISPVYATKQAAKNMLLQLLTITNSGVVYSDGMLKVAPLGDVAASANGINFTPNITPVYDLTDDDFIGNSSADPVTVTRTANADAFNHVQVQFCSRANNYNNDIAEAKDDANIALYGLRTMPPLQMPEICDVAAARAVAQIQLQRALYIRNTFSFTLGWRFALLEPLDLVTLTDSGLGLNKAPVRILSIEETGDGEFHIIAEEFPTNVLNAAAYSTQPSLGFTSQFNVTAPNVGTPILFEPPDQVVNDLELWAAVPGSGNYGGCTVYVSYDGQTYKSVGRVQGSARAGVLTGPLASISGIDTVSTLGVNLEQSLATLMSGTSDDAVNNRTLCYVDGELVSYATATLTYPNRYNLTYLNRGAFGSPVSAHTANSPFARLDSFIFKYPFDINDIGRTIFIKFQSFNQYGGGVQDLATLQPYSYTFKGTALNSPLPSVTNLTSNFQAGITNIIWDPVTDFRTPIDYEVRIGPSWAASRVVARTPINSLAAIGDGTYWIAAHYKAPSGVEAYSATPQSLVISGAILVKNVIAAFDQAALGWPGTTTAPAALVAGNIQTTGAGNILADVNYLTDPSVLWNGGVSLLQGIYTIPTSERVNIGRVAACTVVMNLAGFAQSILDNYLAYNDLLNVTDLLGSYLGPLISLQPQIRTAPASGVFGAWQNYVPGQYSAQYFDGRVLVSTTDPQVFAVLSSFIFTVDVPDRIDTGNNVAVGTSATTINFSTPFNGGPGASAVPLVQPVILNAQQGDCMVLSSTTLGGFIVQVLNGGVGVARNINWTAQGY